MSAFTGEMGKKAMGYFDTDAEKAVLGGMMMSSEIVSAVCDLNSEHFTPPNALIFESLVRLHTAGKPLHPATVTKELGEARRLQQAGGAVVISGLALEASDSPVIARHFAHVLREKWEQRKAHAIAQEMCTALETGAGFKAFDEAIAGVEKARATSLSDAPLTPLMDIATGPPDAGKTVLGHRFLCIHGTMIFVGPSGIGKSSASLQQDILWSLGRPAFGIQPARPLQILTIQAENDAGDLAEMREGVCHGLQLTDADRAAVRNRVFYETECGRSGVEFLTYLDTRLRLAKFDLLRIDPLLAYLGADVKETKDTAAFLRGGLNPLLARHGIACILNHHTPKVTNRDTSGWRGSDWMYAGAGSADITNWARAALIIDPTHANHVFQFIAAKRGNRIGWVDEFGERETTRYYCHASDGLYWREADAEDRVAVENASAVKKTKVKPVREPKLLQFVPPDLGISKNTLIALAQKNGTGLNRARSAIAMLLHEGDLYERPRPRTGTRPEVWIYREPENPLA